VIHVHLFLEGVTHCKNVLQCRLLFTPPPPCALVDSALPPPRNQCANLSVSLT
jgi:hypothetical protein